MVKTSKLKKIGKKLDQTATKIGDKIKKGVEDTVEVAKETKLGEKIADSLTLLLLL